MPITASCETCAKPVASIFCADHGPNADKCDSCSVKTHRLICETCAEMEFGDDGSRPDPDPADLIFFIENAVITDDVGDLAAAIRAGRREDAEYLLDKIARGIPGWEDRISVARYSPLARAA